MPVNDIYELHFFPGANLLEVRMKNSGVVVEEFPAKGGDPEQAGKPGVWELTNMSIRILRTILPCLLLSAVFLVAAIACPAFAEPEPRVCGEYTYIPLAGYRTTEGRYAYNTESMSVNRLSFPRTYKESGMPSIHCILENNNGDYSYRFSAKKRIRLMAMTKEDIFLDINKECNGGFDKYKVYLFSQKDMTSIRKDRLLYMLAIEINEEENEFDTIFAIDMNKYDSKKSNDEIAQEACALARQFITTIKRR